MAGVTPNFLREVQILLDIRFDPHECQSILDDLEFDDEQQEGMGVLVDGGL